MIINRIKREEIIAKKYLLSIGYNDKEIIYEPLGNIPPDFCINNLIAIEVRRLNKNIKKYNKDYSKPIENLYFKLNPKIYNIIKNFPRFKFDHSAYVIVNYSRPLNISKKLFDKIKDVLMTHIRFIDEAKEYLIEDNLSIKILPTPKKYDNLYILGLINDHDNSGFTEYDIYENIKSIIKEKETKIIPHFDKYKYWWLILVDNIGWGCYKDVLSKFNYFSTHVSKFSEIIIIPPFD